MATSIYVYVEVLLPSVLILTRLRLFYFAQHSSKQSHTAAWLKE